jgi:hypothetical protein
MMPNTQDLEKPYSSSLNALLLCSKTDTEKKVPHSEITIKETTEIATFAIKNDSRFLLRCNILIIYLTLLEEIDDIVLKSPG